MPKQRRKRHHYTDEQRTNILEAAKAGHLTAFQVQRKFGVTPVTYYSWRKKTGLSSRRGALAVLAAQGDLSGQVRAEVQSKVRQLLPGIVRSEVSAYLNEVLGTRRGRRLKT